MGSRKTCYKCGSIGHFAENCQHTERLCYNCKQPGHQSTECTLPKTADAKQCYQCQEIGHIQADCPNPPVKQAPGACYNCGVSGHLARNCPESANETTADVPVANPIAKDETDTASISAPTGPSASRQPTAPRAFSRSNNGNRVSTCYKCGGPNHFARNCQADAVKCYACGKSGHISKECPEGVSDSNRAVSKICYNCGGEGHISRDCTSAAKESSTQSVNGSETDVTTSGAPSVAASA